MMYVCIYMYVCMYTFMSGGPVGYWFDYVCMYVCSINKNSSCKRGKRKVLNTVREYIQSVCIQFKKKT